MTNPLVGMSVGAWAVFIMVCVVGEFKWWAWMLWTPWLMFATLAPIFWWCKNRNDQVEGSEGSEAE
jgi:hypothetical protein